ncbi:hypothetical protein [Gemmatimonas sp.]|uniref:hypothetical protein n=1 Tax=Gemmatimonas sp. TaxID=1962908 RepID=UPI00286EA77F|nr:hypothetical protein [Gemmatimonas sp.]
MITPSTFRARAARVALVALLFGAAPLRAQDASPFDAIADDATKAALRSIIADAAARGLPTGALVTKVREGIAKHAAPERIRSATALLADRLAVANTAIAPTRSSDELTAAADALQVGIPASTLRDMRQLWPQRPLTVPLGVLSELVASGVSKPIATRRVRDLLMKGANTTQFALLGTSVQSDIAAGLAPDASMELRSKGVLSLIEQRSTGAGVTSEGSPTRPPGKR